jgi:hypothetical protein
MKHKTLLILLILGVFILGAACGGAQRAARRQPAAENNTAKTPVATATPVKSVPVPPYQTGDGLKSLVPTMSPDIFTGRIRNAYLVAKEIPETLAQMPCYCGCEKSVKHKSLHSCYVDDHASKCGVCMNEAFTAYQLEKQQKMKPEQIRERIIKEYAPRF